MCVFFFFFNFGPCSSKYDIEVRLGHVGPQLILGLSQVNNIFWTLGSCQALGLGQNWNRGVPPLRALSSQTKPIRGDGSHQEVGPVRDTWGLKINTVSISPLTKKGIARWVQALLWRRCLSWPLLCLPPFLVAVPFPTPYDLAPHIPTLLTLSCSDPNG